ncbi:hypothetical protein HDU96_006422 [Phlyctochytrium bullatum]|nr:hypothetical protein HDU96_006422 [Phlyctochytrium bullatum]
MASLTTAAPTTTTTTILNLPRTTAQTTMMVTRLPAAGNDILQTPGGIAMMVLFPLFLVISVVWCSLWYIRKNEAEKKEDEEQYAWEVARRDRILAQQRAAEAARKQEKERKKAEKRLEKEQRRMPLQNLIMDSIERIDESNFPRVASWPKYCL